MARDADDEHAGKVPAETPGELREGVREGILDALAYDLDRTRSGITFRLALAGALGVAAAIGSMVLFSGGTLASDHGLHLAVCAAAWGGILVECFVVILLRIEGRRLSLGHATTLALIGFLLAAALGAFCPHPHYLAWWTETALGGAAARAGGPAWSAFCLGICIAALVAVGASAIAGFRSPVPRGRLLSAMLLFLLLWPAIILQSSGLPGSVFFGWTAGLAAGIVLGALAGTAIDRVVGVLST